MSVPQFDTFVSIADNIAVNKHLLRKIAKRIKELRRKNGLTQDDLSFNSGISRSTIGNIETAKNDIVISKLNAVAKALNTDLSEFFDFTK